VTTLDGEFGVDDESPTATQCDPSAQETPSAEIPVTDDVHSAPPSVVT
jgi:hypothetical protein